MFNEDRRAAKSKTIKKVVRGKSLSTNFRQVQT
jgi:hypothetical protein